MVYTFAHNTHTQNKMAKLTNLYTVKSIAHQYNYSQVYLYRLVKKGVVQVICIDGIMFIDVTSLPSDFGKKKKKQ